VQLRLVENIQNGPDWLADAGLREFLQREGLDDVTIECLGARRSFSGKAWPHLRLIHMVSEGVHPLRWLLTLMHELAHVADFRQRVRDMEAEWGRAFVPGRRDGWVVWKLDRVHGKRWRAEFVRLIEAAIAHGLFPGNEAQARHAASVSTTSLDDVDLDLGADPRIDAPELRRLDDERRAHLIEALRNRSLFKHHFPPGETIHFDGGPRRGVVTGTMVRVNQRTATVSVRNELWHVPIGMLRLGPAPADAQPERRPLDPHDRFSPGQPVAFRFNGRRYRGEIVRVNRKTCTVRTTEGDWRVAFALIRTTTP
jgi:hypothetical protein